MVLKKTHLSHLLSGASDKVSGALLQQLKSICVVICLVVVSVVFVTPAYAAQSSLTPMKVLEQMAQASRELSYTGSLTYEQGGNIETFRVTHRVTEGREFERLEHLSGPKQAVERTGRTTDCIEPGERLLRGLSIDTSPAELKDSYRLHFAGSGRVAGRSALELDVLSKDQYRYSYRLSIDKETKLLLRSLRLDHKKRVVERFQFVDLQLILPEREKQGASDRKLSLASSSIEIVKNQSYIHQAPSKLGSCHGEEIKPKRWLVTWLPQGFELSGQRLSSSSVFSSDMLSFSDGLANFSVFVEPFKKQPFIQGHVQKGATAAFSTRLNLNGQDCVVSVVGEISGLAAKQIAESVTLVQ